MQELPAGTYDYLDAPEVGSEVELKSEAELPRQREEVFRQLTGVDRSPPLYWRGTLYVGFLREESLFDRAEIFFIRVQKKGEGLRVVECQRDGAFARDLARKMAAAKFVLEYIRHPEKRPQLDVPGVIKNQWDVPASNQVSIRQQEIKGLALQMAIVRRMPSDDGFAHDQGQGVLYEVVCGLEGPGIMPKRGKYRFTILQMAAGTSTYKIVRARMSYP